MSDMSQTTDGLAASMNQSMVQRLTEALGNMGCAYAVRTPQGEVIESPDWIVKPPKRHSNKPLASDLYGRGTLTNYFKPFLADVQVGQIGKVPVGDFNPQVLAQCMRSWASTAWGAASYEIAITNDGNVLIARTLAGLAKRRVMA